MRRLAFALLLGLWHAAPAMAQSTGCLPISKERYEQSPIWQRPEVGPPPPAQLDLRPFMPAVGNQGEQPSCVGWAVAYACGSYYEGIRRGRKPRGLPAAPDALGPCALSPAYVYNQIKGPKGGSYIHEALEVWQGQGLVSLETMPYSDSDDTRLPTAAMREEARDVRIRRYERLLDGRAVRAALAVYRPVVICLLTTDRFMAAQGVYDRREHSQGTSRAGHVHGHHALCIVGYDDRRRAFLVQNSWGTKWGEGGYGWMGYDLFERIGPGGAVEEAWVAEPRRLMHPWAYEALVPREDRVTGVSLYSMGSREAPGSGPWTFTVAVAPPSARYDDIEAIVWSLEEDGVPRAVTSRDPGRQFELLSTQSRPGLREVRALIRFRDGSMGEARHRLMLFEEE